VQLVSAVLPQAAQSRLRLAAAGGPTAQVEALQEQYFWAASKVPN
jgi:hypothetical protein